MEYYKDINNIVNDMLSIGKEKKKDKECEKCDGKGYAYQDDNVDCDECHGTGKEQLTETEKREKELMKEESVNTDIFEEEE